MKRRLVIRHVTEYRYSEPVGFGRHRMMLRPRDSHTLRLTESTLKITPTPERVRWAYDVFGNSVAHADFGDATADTLRFESVIRLLHYEASEPTHLLSPTAKHYPFRYSDEELPDLLPVMAMHEDTDAQSVIEWAGKACSQPSPLGGSTWRNERCIQPSSSIWYRAPDKEAPGQGVAEGFARVGAPLTDWHHLAGNINPFRLGVSSRPHFSSVPSRRCPTGRCAFPRAPAGA